jgi:hypothetical protein
MVLPSSLLNSYSQPQQSWILNLSDFLTETKLKQAKFADPETHDPKLIC